MILIFSIEYIIGLALIGIIAGFASGLLGVGRWFLIVPLQYFLLEYSGVSPSLTMLTSFGTSLAIIIPTATSGAYRHSKSLDGILKTWCQIRNFWNNGRNHRWFHCINIAYGYYSNIFWYFLIFIAIYNFITVNNSKSESKISFNMINSELLGFL